MPEIRYRLRWPDDSVDTCYSPSLVVKDWFEPGATYPLPEFLRRAREAMRIASDRVEAKYGFPCSRAAGELARIERRAAGFAALEGAGVQLIAFEE